MRKLPCYRWKQFQYISNLCTTVTSLQFQVTKPRTVHTNTSKKLKVMQTQAQSWLIFKVPTHQTWPSLSHVNQVFWIPSLVVVFVRDAELTALEIAHWTTNRQNRMHNFQKHKINNWCVDQILVYTVKEETTCFPINCKTQPNPRCTINSRISICWLSSDKWSDFKTVLLSTLHLCALYGDVMWGTLTIFRWRSASIYAGLHYLHYNQSKLLWILR